MYRIFPSAWYLLLLLTCDWIGDPYFGHSPLSQPFANQVMVSPAKAKLDNERQKVSDFGNAHLLAALGEAAGASLWQQGLREVSRTVWLTSHSIYILMTIRR